MAAGQTEFGIVPDHASDDAITYDKLRRRLLWGIANGLYLLGTHQYETPHVMAVSWVTQVATAPKLLAVSVEFAAKTAGCIDDSGNFLLALLPRERKEIVRKFVKPELEVVTTDGGLSIQGLAFGLSEFGNPFPLEALGYLEMRLVSRTALGSHVLYLGEVCDAVLVQGEAEILTMRDTRMNYGG